MQGLILTRPIEDVFNYKKKKLDQDYNHKFEEVFSLLEDSDSMRVSKSEIICTLLQFKELVPEIQIERFVSENGIKPRDEDTEITVNQFKELLESMIA